MTSPENFSRSVGGAAGRGLVLVGAAVLLGLILLRFAFDDNGVVDATPGEGTTITSVAGSTEDPTTTDVGSTATTVAGGVVTTTPTTTPAAAVDEVLHDNNTVTVMTANGSGTPGEAGRLAEKLTAVNYITDPANAESTSSSKIYYRPGYVEDAKNVATVLGAPADLIQPMPEAPALQADAATPERFGVAQIVVIIGSDQLIP